METKTKHFIEKTLNENDEITLGLSVLKDKEGYVDFSFETKDNDEVSYKTLAQVINHLLKNKEKMGIFLNELKEINENYDILVLDKEANRKIDKAENNISEITDFMNKNLGSNTSLVLAMNANPEDIEDNNKSIPMVFANMGDANLLAYGLNKAEDILSGDSIRLKQEDAFYPENEQQRAYMEAFNLKNKQLKDYKNKKLKELEKDDE